MTDTDKCPNCHISLGSDGGCHYPYCDDPQEPTSTDPLLAPLDVKTIDQLFQNVEKVEDEKPLIYRVRNEVGSDAGMITYLGKNEWRVYVDNFPSEKKYFSWNLPVKTVGDFISDMKRTGLELIAV